MDIICSELKRYSDGGPNYREKTNSSLTVRLGFSAVSLSSRLLFFTIRKFDVWLKKKYFGICVKSYRELTDLISVVRVKSVDHSSADNPPDKTFTP